MVVYFPLAIWKSDLDSEVQPLTLLRSSINLIFKANEKQELLEIRYSVGNIGSYSSTDCHEHNLVHGVWSPGYLREKPSQLSGGILFILYL